MWIINNSICPNYVGEEEKDFTPMSDETLANLVDNILDQHDSDFNGFLDWYEYNMMLRSAKEDERREEREEERVVEEYDYEQEPEPVEEHREYKESKKLKKKKSRKH